MLTNQKRVKLTSLFLQCTRLLVIETHCKKSVLVQHARVLRLLDGKFIVAAVADSILAQSCMHRVVGSSPVEGMKIDFRFLSFSYCFSAVCIQVNLGPC